jgi:hypothetical protein
MSIGKPAAALATVTAALALAIPAASASAATWHTGHDADVIVDSYLPGFNPLFPGGVANPVWQYLYATCPIWFGTRNPAIGCSPYPPFLP